jgi:hypothetical protein
VVFDAFGLRLQESGGLLLVVRCITRRSGNRHDVGEQDKERFLMHYVSGIGVVVGSGWWLCDKRRREAVSAGIV